MKKLFMAMAVGLGMCEMLQAQNENVEKVKVALEVQANPFSSDFKMFRLGSDDGGEQYKVKLKCFVADQHALRFGLGFGLDRETVEEDSKYGKDKASAYNGIFSFDLGYEYHFQPSNRIDTYVGGEVGGFYNFIGEKYTHPLNNGLSDTKEYIHRNSDDDLSNFGLKLCGLTGINFFVCPRLYLGTELGLKLSLAKCCDSWIEYDGRSQKHDEYKGYESPKYLNLKFYVEPALRIGWMF